MNGLVCQDKREIAPFRTVPASGMVGIVFEPNPDKKGD